MSLTIKFPALSLAAFRRATLYGGTTLAALAYALLLYAGWLLHPAAFVLALAIEAYYVAQGVLAYYELAERTLQQQQMAAEYARLKESGALDPREQRRMN